MRILRLGSTGSDVRDWELFLCGQGFYVEEVDGIFSKETAQATKDFQGKYSLSQDGSVGRETFGIAVSLGYGVLRDDSEDINGYKWPPKPSGLSSLSFQEKERLFGHIDYVAAPVTGNPEAIKITNSWQKDNLVSVDIPQLKGVQGAPGNCKIFWHKNGVEQVTGLFKAWETAGMLHKIVTWGGSWVPRFVRGSRTTLSNHSHAIAFDINVQWNGLKVHPAKLDEKGSVRALVPLAIDHGFFWGGFWDSNYSENGRADGMHFELYR